MPATPPLARHGLLLTVLLAACAGPSIPGPGGRAFPLSTAVVFTDAVTKVRAYSADEVSAGRLFAAAVKGLETASPKGAIRVTADEGRAQLTHGESVSAGATLAVSLRAAATPADVGAALNEAARFAISRLGTPPTDVVDAMLRGLMTVDPEGSYISAAANAALENPKSFGGVGLELTIRHGVLRVVSSVPGSPAERAACAQPTTS